MLSRAQEFRQAARALAQRPAFALTVVVTLAMAIGATVAIFAVVDSILIQPLPYEESERIMWIRHQAPGLELPELENSPGTLTLYEQHARSFTALAAVTTSERNLSGDMEAARIQVLETTPSLFDVLRVRPELGRRLLDSDVRPGAAPVALLTHSGWSTHFGKSASVVGTSVTLNDVSTEIVGVMPEGFSHSGVETAALLPVRPDSTEGFGSFGIGVMARLGPGIDIREAQRELTALQDRIPEMFPTVPREFLQRVGWTVSVQPLRDIIVAEAEAALWIVLGAAVFVLVVASASVATLFLVRADARQREIGIRMALGAGRARIAACFLHESMLLGIIGGAGGGAVSILAVRALVVAGPAQLPRLNEVSVNGTAIVLAMGVSLGAGVLFGILPAARQFSLPELGLSSAGRTHSATRDRQRVRKTLIVAQIALALILLTGSGLMLRSFRHLMAVEPGFDPRGVITVGISFGDNKSKREAADLTHEILDVVRSYPGVEAAGAANSLPLDPTGINGGSFHMKSRPRLDDAVPPVAMYSIATDGFHEALGTQLLRGRAFTPRDQYGQQPVAIVNELFARTYLDGQAVGEFITFGMLADSVWHEIVGVVEDVRVFGLREEIRPSVYLPITTPISGARPTLMYVTLRTSADLPAVASLVRSVVQRLDGNIPLTTARTMRSITAEELATTSFTTTILSVAALVAMFLGGVGLYGVVGYVVSQRTKEIGVRIALGAAPNRVRTMVLRQGLGLAGAGVALGLIGAVVLSELLDALLFEVDSQDPVVFLAVPVGLLLVTALASYLPARRAAAISPLEALRSE